MYRVDVVHHGQPQVGGSGHRADANEVQILRHARIAELDGYVFCQKNRQQKSWFDIAIEPVAAAAERRKMYAGAELHGFANWLIVFDIAVKFGTIEIGAANRCVDGCFEVRIRHHVDSGEESVDCRVGPKAHYTNAFGGKESVVGANAEVADAAVVDVRERAVSIVGIVVALHVDIEAELAEIERSVGK